MKAKIYQNKFNYSDYSKILAKKNKVVNENSTFTSKLTESKNYTLLIDDYYKSINKFKKNHHHSNFKEYLLLIIKFIEQYNKFYHRFLTFDKIHNTHLSVDLTHTIKRFEFNLNNIGIHLNQTNLLTINTNVFEKELQISITNLDFLFERHGLLDKLTLLYTFR